MRDGFNPLLLIMFKITFYCEVKGQPVPGVLLIILRYLYCCVKVEIIFMIACRVDYSSAESPAPRYSLYILAMFETEMPLGHSASQA